MEKLTILAATPESARGLYDALSGFQTTIVETDDERYVVEITLTGGDGQIVELLNAIEQHVTARGTEPARVTLSGRTYNLHPSPQPGGAAP